MENITTSNGAQLAPVDAATLPTLPRPSKQSGFVFQPGSYAEVMQLCKMLSSSDIIPKSLQGKEGNIYIILQMGARLGIDPGFMLQNTFVVNGRPAMYGDLPLSIVRASGLMQKIEEGYEVGGVIVNADAYTTKTVPDDFTAVCVVTRNGKVARTTFSVADAKEASLWGSTSPWKNYWKRMLKFRARGFALRDEFGDVLQGLVVGEEQDDIAVKNVTPAPTQAAVGGVSRTDQLLGRMLPTATVGVPVATIEHAAEATRAPSNDEEKSEEQPATSPQEETPDAAAQVTMREIIAQARRKGLSEDALRMLVSNVSGTPKLTKKNIHLVVDAINDLPIPAISEADLDKIRGAVAMPDMRMLAVAAQQSGLTAAELAQAVNDITGATTLTAGGFKAVLAALDAGAQG